MHITTNRVFRDSKKVPYCHDLLRLLGKSEPDDEPVEIGRIMEVVPVSGYSFQEPLLTALYLLQFVDGHEKEKLLMSIDYARLVQGIPNGTVGGLLKLKETLDVAEQFANGVSTEQELVVARNGLKWAADLFRINRFVYQYTPGVIEATYTAYTAMDVAPDSRKLNPWLCCKLAMHVQGITEDLRLNYRCLSPDWVKKYEAVLKKYL